MSHSSPNTARCGAYYTATVNQESDYPSLNQAIDVDVAIVGGGFTGVNTALELAEKGLNVALLEANKIAWGATGRNGGQVTGSLSGDEAMRKQMRNKLGKDVDDFIWNLRWRGHDIIKERVQKYNIDCDLKYGHLHAAYKPSHMKELQASYDLALANGMGDQVKLLLKNDIPDYLETEIYHGALYNKKNMHLHSLNLCLGEAAAAQQLGVQIFENTLVMDIKQGQRPQVITENGVVTANTVLLAGNAYHRLQRSKMSGKIFPAAGGIVATEPLGELAEQINPKDLAVYDCRFVLDYYRMTADKRLLFGGGANYSGKPSRDIAAELRPAIERTFPALKGVGIDYQWSGMMGIVINRIPQLGKLSENVFYAQGYSGHGIATSHIVSEIMANAITGHLNEFDTFAQCSHIRVPGSEWLGNQFLAIGMWYYLLLEKFK
ncbi:FAD-dependent oxidoreductase [Oleiphilus sp. HI0009]|uniref:NAD(P)/FAD-dependent oxidoreductase n=1 Tax=Oleiphilus sp. HI0125 TaxID=1822266 RepID=UPI0007C2C06D|nr:FAD-binding oxidoreductase [Oleiphilus sp. HI0125]KZX79485.1 FAD-dependent oxidoreductase [Oleiphilus sp. HI0009]KZZ56144.1 FAD-dependent oxidoreductase [Oleiphilus sp. HI0125]MCH2157998.1 FAD-binding oxidoreductase [Oleiphilaceae bacterium]